MTNLIRSDIYRILRGKGLYITLGIFLAIIVIQVAGGANMNAGVDPAAFEMLEMEDFENLSMADFFHSPTGAEAPFQVMAASANILYFLLPLIIFISAADFSSGAAKNTLASGVSRCRYYGAKVILSCICCALLLLVYLLLSTLLATLINGFGGAFDGEYIGSVLKIFFAQLWLCIACACVINFIVFAFRRTAAAIGATIAFILAPSMVMLVLMFANEWFENLFDYDLPSAIGALARVNGMSSGDIAKLLAVGAGYIAAASIGGFMLFRKAEIK
jgi:ABC-type transport system involved in multi-copper enzyme maturation permease subunit